MKNYIQITIVFALSLFITNCGSKESETVADNSTPIAVKVSATENEEGSKFITASGKIEAENSANLSTRLMGFVTKVHVKMGQKVSKGQLLISIKNTDLQAKKAQVESSILQAEAGFNNAKKDYERFVALFEQQSASQKELDDMTSRFEMAKAGLEGAKQMKNEVNAQFSYANITAPFSGFVTNTFIKEGDMANPGMPLVSVESPSKLQVTTMVSESNIESVKKGMPVEVLVKSSNTQLKGSVSEVSMSAKNTGGQYLVKINVDKTEERVLPGMFVNVQFPIENDTIKDNNIVLIPKNALVKQGQLTGVYTVAGKNTAMLRWLRIGKSFGDKVEVLSGLSNDEKYIVSAEGKLFNGAKISIQ